MKFNINNNVRVTLTEYGANILNAYFSGIKKKLEEVNTDYDFMIYNSGDSYKCQMWHLMKIFGGHLMNGNESPFKDCIVELNAE